MCTTRMHAHVYTIWHLDSQKLIRDGIAKATYAYLYIATFLHMHISCVRMHYVISIASTIIISIERV